MKRATKITYSVHATQRPAAGKDWWVKFDFDDGTFLKEEGFAASYRGGCRKIRKRIRKTIGYRAARKVVMP